MKGNGSAHRPLCCWMWPNNSYEDYKYFSFDHKAPKLMHALHKFPSAAMCLLQVWEQLHCVASPQTPNLTFCVVSFGRSSHQLGCTVAAVSAQPPWNMSKYHD